MRAASADQAGVGARSGLVQGIACISIFEDLNKIAGYPIAAEGGWVLLVVLLELVGLTIVGGVLVAAALLFFVLATAVLLYKVEEAESHLWICLNGPGD